MNELQIKGKQEAVKIQIIKREDNFEAKGTITVLGFVDNEELSTLFSYWRTEFEVVAPWKEKKLSGITFSWFWWSEDDDQIKVCFTITPPTDNPDQFVLLPSEHLNQQGRFLTIYNLGVHAHLLESLEEKGVINRQEIQEIKQKAKEEIDAKLPKHLGRVSDAEYIFKKMTSK